MVKGIVLTQKDIKRFWSKVQKTDDCWLWTASLVRSYGQFSVCREGKQTMVTAHRVSWLIEHGCESPLFVCHTCDIKRCVRPTHLFEGTNQENQLDALSKGLLPVGEQNHRAKLTVADVKIIRELCRQGIHQRDIAKKFSISQRLVCKIHLRRLWKHVA